MIQNFRQSQTEQQKKSINYNIYTLKNKRKVMILWHVIEI